MRISACRTRAASNPTQLASSQQCTNLTPMQHKLHLLSLLSFGDHEPSLAITYPSSLLCPVVLQTVDVPALNTACTCHDFHYDPFVMVALNARLERSRFLGMCLLSMYRVRQGTDHSNYRYYARHQRRHLTVDASARLCRRG